MRSHKPRCGRVSKNPCNASLPHSGFESGRGAGNFPLVSIFKKTNFSTEIHDNCQMLFKLRVTYFNLSYHQ